MKFKNTYLLLVTIIGLFSLILYSTYAMFTASVDIGEFVNLTASTLPTDTSLLEYERITLNTGDSKTMDLNITNSTNDSLYYGVWYEMIEPSTINDNIVVAKLDTSESETFGKLATNATSTVTLILENYTSDSIVINIGVGYSSTSSLNFPDNRSLITDVASEGIDASTLPTPVNFYYTGAVQEYTIPNTGNYKLEVWGAQGGSYSTTYTGGLGGYSYGTISLEENTKLYIYVGGQAASNTQARVTVTGGYNGGGNGYNRYYSSVYTYGQGGGGASDIRIDVNNDNSTTLYERVIVAGGGSGSTNRTNGYYGGGTTGGYGTSGYQGTQTAAGTNGSFGTGGSATTSGNNYKYGSAGGGGGWYGGGASTSYSDSTNYDAYSGGGSGFVLTTDTASSVPSSYLITDSSYYLTDAQTIAGNTSFTSPTGTTETGHSGNGYARITPVSTVPSLEGLSLITIKEGSSYNLLEDVTCVDNGDGCTILKTDITDTSTLAEGNYTISYIVKDNNNIKYKFTRTLIIGDNLDNSGANYPDLIDGIIPIVYDESKSSWVKADIEDKNSEYKWYDYDNKQWANAVLVTDTNRSTYQSASVGTEVLEDDILAYYVWIPRYKYKVWNITKTVGTDSYDAYNTGIDIVFESGTNSTGTISCNDYSFASPTSSTTNETCSGANGEYYTHPAFTFGDTKVTGIWVGKFEVSSSNTSADYGGNTSTTLTVRIKPNVTSWRNNYLSSYSYIIQKMQTSGNEYGLTTDKTQADSHMLKNMEWGAVAYLTNSNYGRCSNGTCSEVGINNNSSYTTGCGASARSSSSSTCNAYNTTTGMLASTTGNIYGIYDMSGGAGEYVMGNMSGGSGSYIYYQYDAGRNFSYSTTTAKYIDTYAFGNSTVDQTAYNCARLGDATGENVLKTGSTGGWYSDYANFFDSTNPWFYRGGVYDSSSNAGVFNFNDYDGDSHDYISARAALLSLQ